MDARVLVFLNDEPYAEVVATPLELEYLALGLLYTRGIIDGLGQIKRLEVKGAEVRAYVDSPRSGGGILREYEDCGGPAEPAGLARRAADGARDTNYVKIAVRLAPEFSKFTMPSTEPQLAMHTSALYLGGRWLVAHDTSRHSGVLKLVGKALELGGSYDDAVAFTTGRLSADMVVALARLGMPAAVSLRGPLYSALTAACRYGVAVVANVRGKGFVQLCP